MSWIPTMIDAGAKGALLLIAIFVVTRLMRGASAATRHVAWAVGIVVLIALPVLSAVLPRLEVVPVPAPAVEQVTPPPAPAASPEENTETRRPKRAVFASNDAALPDAEELAARLVSGTSDPAVAEAEACPLFSRCTVATVAAITPAEGFVALWIVIAFALLVRLAIGAIAARRLVSRAIPVRDPSWRQLLQDAQEMAGVDGAVRLYESTDVGMPVTLGILRPTIVMPPVATSWSEERRLTVLVHELAHIRRNDVATCLVARVACALHWMNPLVWRAARKLRDECERACDDLVIRAGMTASTYADDLLDIVRNAGTSRSPAVALPMAQRSDFEGRLLAILDPIGPRRAPSRARSLAVAVFVAAIAMPLAAMAPAPAGDASDEAEETVAYEKSASHDEGTAIGVGDGAREGSGLGEVTAVFENLGTELGLLKDEVLSNVAASLETAKDVAADYGNDIALRFDIQAPEPPQPSQPHQPMSDPQSKQAKQHDKHEQDSEANERAVAGLSAALTDGDALVRLAAAEGLGGLEDPRAVEALSRALRTDESVEVRRMAAWALGEIEDAAGVPALSDALRSDRDDEVRRMAAWALGEIESGTAVEALGAALKDSSPEVRKTAVWALGEIESPNGVPHLLPFLKDENAEIRSQAAWALGEIESPRAVEALSAAIGDREPKVREMVVWALGEIEDANAVAALSRALSDANVGVRRKAAWALGEIDLTGEAPPALIEATRDQDREVRKIAAHALGEIGDPASVGALAVLARGQDNALRYAAVHALSEIEDSAAVEVLVELLKDADPEVRKIAAQALGKR
ncbi:MAG TPA: M56 family metallopeptidase [Gemmatimonadaceae bacterium]|nr:M56 family metallopeptidase [Gemmatimonadaceae bacterium]